MRSRVHECRVLHARLRPRAHRFTYRIFWLELDLDELPALDCDLRLLAIDRPGLFSFRQDEHLPHHGPPHRPSADPAVLPSPAGKPPPSPLKARVLAALTARGLHPGREARVVLLTLPRVLGYRFNPVSFYFVSTADNHPFAALAEVTNTFRETKTYLLGPETLTHEPRLGPTFRLRTPKFFYVSPFSDVDVAFDFRLRPPGPDGLALQIDDRSGDNLDLVSTVTSLGRPLPLTDRTLTLLALKYPLITLKVIAAIHWEALRLWRKRVPWFAKAARAADQRDLHHPHASLTRSPLS